jgi:BlaI family transcriptional regulator, penicillinase repressor
MRKAAGAREIPPPLELLCLKALWSIGEGNVKDVRSVVAGTKLLAYTTVMTVLERLARKGVVSRRKVGRAFVYAPQAEKDAIRRLALREFLNCYFDGSAEGLIAFIEEQRPAEQQQASVSTAGSEQRLDTALL